MPRELADALAARGRTWGERNADTLAALRKGTLPCHRAERPCVSAYSLDTGADNVLHRVLFSGTVTKIPPAI